jgi:hypothetical protein
MADMDASDSRKPKSVSNHEYYVKHKEKNHRDSLLSCIRHRGRVPLLRTAWKRGLTMEDVDEAWHFYVEKCMLEGVDIPHLKLLEMRVLIGNLIP